MNDEERAELIADLQRDEGLRLTPYLDTVGKWTIGVGRNLTDNGIRPDEAAYLLQNDIDDVLDDLAGFPWWAGLDPVRQRVLANMRFNLGPNKFRGFTRMLRAVEAGDYVRAADSMRRSLWATQVKTRAQRLIVLMLNGESV